MAAADCVSSFCSRRTDCVCVHFHLVFGSVVLFCSGFRCWFGLFDSFPDNASATGVNYLRANILQINAIHPGRTVSPCYDDLKATHRAPITCTCTQCHTNRRKRPRCISSIARHFFSISLSISVSFRLRVTRDVQGQSRLFPDFATILFAHIHTLSCTPNTNVPHFFSRMYTVFLMYARAHIRPLFGLRTGKICTSS